jgi:CobQ-like glutamine amidotransferase family enzyme
MNYELVIGWLYPELMSTYGDRGNVLCLTRRGEWRGIGVAVREIGGDQGSRETLQECDLLLGGGAQDRQQAIVARSMFGLKEAFRKFCEEGKPALFVCGSPQLLGHYYVTAGGEKLEGLGIFDMVTEGRAPGEKRLIGNLVARLSPWLVARGSWPTDCIVGFENHGGRTYLGEGVRPLAKVVCGFGNNGKDKTEGAVYKNWLATYSHGPFLPKNPHFADWLIKTALEVKYHQGVQLEPLNDALEWQAHDFVMRKYGR